MNSAGKQFAKSFMEFFVFLSKFFVDRPGSTLKYE